MFNPNPAFLLLQMFDETSPKGFTLGVIKADIEKNSSICPNLALIAEQYELVFPQMQKKKDTIKFGRPICNPWGQCSNIH
jgi:hypothetical protein